MFRKLDTSSRLLVITSLIGIAVSIGLYYFFSFGGKSNGSGIKLGTITHFKNDTRVKQTDSIHWDSVTKSINCFDGDLIFTGKDSFMTVELTNGDKINLHPHSLISLTKEQITLDFGVIELDLSSDSQLKLKTPDQKLDLKEKSKLKISHTPEEKSIIPLNKFSEVAYASSNLSKDEISAITPEAGKVFPFIPEHKVQFNWKSKGTEKKFQLEFYDSKDSTAFLKIPAENYSVELPISKLHEGIIYWKVTSSAGESDYSSFYVSKNIQIVPISPANNEILPSPQARDKGVDFSWNTTLDLPATIQIATDDSFQNIIFQNTTEHSSQTAKINDPGRYFWRVGYEVQKNRHQWSPSIVFLLNSQTVIFPLKVKLTSETFDFTLTPSYHAEIEDKNNCQEYKYVLSKKNHIIRETISANNKYTFTKMDEGDYNLKVIGLKNKIQLTETSIDFQVKNSPPLKSPKIIKGKKKLYVILLESIAEAILPSALAKNTSIQLSWLKEEQDEVYEVEILNDGKTILKETNSPHYYFTPNHPGLYKWRVRSKKYGQWGPFSKYETIDVEDKITLLQEPLMISPAADSVLKHEENQGKFTFLWKEPYPDFKYFLEFYTDPDSTPIKVTPVSGGKKIVRFSKNTSNLWWRVSAQSSFGNFANEPKKNKISFKKDEEEAETLTGESIYLRFNLAKVNSSYKQSFDNISIKTADVPLTGYLLSFNGEYWPLSKKKKHGANLGIAYKDLSNKNITAKDLRLSAEYGFTFLMNPLSYHRLFLGIQHGLNNLTTNESSSSEFAITYASLRYLYNKQLNEKWSFELNTGIRQFFEFKTGPASYNLSPAFYYKIMQQYSLHFFADYNQETIDKKIKLNGRSGNFKNKSQDLSFGLGIVWAI